MSLSSAETSKASNLALAFSNHASLTPIIYVHDHKNSSAMDRTRRKPKSTVSSSSASTGSCGRVDSLSKPRICATLEFRETVSLMWKLRVPAEHFSRGLPFLIEVNLERCRHFKVWNVSVGGGLFWLYLYFETARPTVGRYLRTTRRKQSMRTMK